MALAGLGEAGTALGHAERFAERLRELGATPAEATRQLIDRIRRGRVRAREPLSRPSQVEHRRAPLIGRANELVTLLDVWDCCRAGREPRPLCWRASPEPARRGFEELLGRVVLRRLRRPGPRSRVTGPTS